MAFNPNFPFAEILPTGHADRIGIFETWCHSSRLDDETPVAADPSLSIAITETAGLVTGGSGPRFETGAAMAESPLS